MDRGDLVLRAGHGVTVAVGIPELVGAGVALAVPLVLPSRRRAPVRLGEAMSPVSHPDPARGPGVDMLRRGRIAWATGAGFAGLFWFPGPSGVTLGLLLSVATWVLIDRSEPPGERRARDAARRDFPHVVSLLAATLRAGSPPGPALDLVCSALPGAAADRLAGLRARLSLGVDPAEVWRSLAGDPVLAPLGRTLARAHSSGAPVADAVARLAQDLSRRQRSDAEDRARTVGVKAAIPLGVCLLPAFLLLGIVPVVAGLLTTLLG